MKVIGLTGRIGSGKSCVARFLENLGAVHIDADKVGHDVYNPGTPAWKEITDTFGHDVVSPEGSIDRQKLSSLVFNDPTAHAKLNEILHPKIRQKVEDSLECFRRQGKIAAVVEAILLVEAGWMDMIDELWLVTAPLDLTLERLKQRGLSKSEALARLEVQTPSEKLLPMAKVLIENEGDLDDLKARVERLWVERIAAAEHNNLQ